MTLTLTDEDRNSIRVAAKKLREQFDVAPLPRDMASMLILYDALQIQGGETLLRALRELPTCDAEKLVLGVIRESQP